MRGRRATEPVRRRARALATIRIGRSAVVVIQVEIDVGLCLHALPVAASSTRERTRRMHDAEERSGRHAEVTNFTRD